ncbi:MAG: hypothetical protein AAF216_07910 [Pseudomonadota bacterium]
MRIGTVLRPDVFRLRPKGQPASAVFPLGLGRQGVHEVCETRFGDMAALSGFSLAAAGGRAGAVVLVSQDTLGLDHGRLLQSGLGALQHKPPDVLHIQTCRLTDALWAVEEALRSGAVGLVMAELERVDFTASRRLALASSRQGVPAILLLPYTCQGSTAASARWRVSPRPSAPNRFDPRAPGHPRWRAVLERSRIAPHLAGHAFDLELNDETLSLCVVSGLAADTSASGTRSPHTDGEADDRRARA